MKVYVFGNIFLLVVVIYGLWKIVENEDSDVRNYVMKNFYVDDGFIFLFFSVEVIRLLKKIQVVLNNVRIRFYKIVLNDVEVMEVFLFEDLEKNLMLLDIGFDDLFVQYSLGLLWDINLDSFIYSICILEKFFIKRGFFFVVNSLFDFLGFIVFIVIYGRILYREVGECNSSWDDFLFSD